MPNGQPSPERAIIESMFRIPNKQGEPVDFKLNAVQARLDTELTGRDIIPKARQLGISTYYLARFTALCMTRKNFRAVVISHEEGATKRLLRRAKFIIENLRSPSDDIELVLETDRLSQAEINFKETGSWFYIGTAGARAFARGDTLNAIHCSELAFWVDAEHLLSGLIGSMPDGGEIGIESTGKGVGNSFHRRYVSALNSQHLVGTRPWKVHFFPFHADPTNSVDLDKATEKTLLESLDEEYEEPRLVNELGLTAGQIAWRRQKIVDLAANAGGYVHLKSVKEEFPTTPDECFQATGNTVFERVTYEPTSKWNRTLGKEGGMGRLSSHPWGGYHYVMGVDSSGGVGKDNASIQIACIETNEQVLAWYSNRVPPDLLTGRVIKLGKEFNEAYLVVEANNHGLVVLQGLREIVEGAPAYPPHLIYRPRPKGIDPKKKEKGLLDLGFQTQQRTKALAVGRLTTMLANGHTIHDENTFMELQAFGEDENGRLCGLDGSPDDRVMAYVMVAAGWTKGSLIGQESEGTVPFTPHPFSIEAILAEKGRKIDSDSRTNDGFPIPSYLEGED